MKKISAAKRFKKSEHGVNRSYRKSSKRKRKHRSGKRSRSFHKDNVQVIKRIEDVRVIGGPISITKNE